MNANRSTVDRRDALLLVVDIQKSMFDLCLEQQRVRKNIEALIDCANILEIPVVFTEHNAEKLGGFDASLLKKSPESPVYNKLEFGCLANTEIENAVRRSRRKTIVLAGIESHVCIFQTAVGALNARLGVHVVADAVSARSIPNLNAGLKRMERAGAVKTTVEMLVFELLQKAGTDDFRNMLPVIKRL